MKQKRNSSIELLRIISMICIILSHFTVHGGVNILANVLPINRFFFSLTILGNLGVDIFIAITGWFYTSKLRIEKIICFYFQVVFYTLGIYLLLVTMKIIPFNWEDLVVSLTPISNETYWFATSFFICYLFTPALSILITKSNKRTLKYIIFVMIIIWSVVPNLTNKPMNGNAFIELIMVYVISAYAHKYQDEFSINKVRIVILVCVTVLVIYGIIGLYFAWNKCPIVYLQSELGILSRSSILTILLAVSLVYVFANRPPLFSSFINIMAQGTFGVYLLHENTYIRGELWCRVNAMSERFAPTYSIVFALVCVSVVFFIGSMVDVIRINTVERILKFLLSKVKRCFEFKKDNCVTNIE